MPLNPKLYDLLRKRFGQATISNENEAMSCRYRPDAFSNNVDLEIMAWGESYYIDCPFCGESRHRLSINHRYGVYDPVTDSDHFYLARCFNENCLKEPGLRQQLKEKIFGFMNCDQRRRTMVLTRGVRPVTDSTSLPPATLPGKVVELSDLAEDHPAIIYLRNRGFDPVELSFRWHVCLCEEASSPHRMAQDRLIIPIYMNNVLVGWQARHVGEHNWTQLKLPKYYTMPSFRKSFVLYNHDQAKLQPCVVVCEGPSDVWRIGAPAVALLGKQASIGQLQILVREYRSKPIVVLLDGDASADANRLIHQLRPFARDRLIQVTLPVGRDPGSYNRAELWSLIESEATRQKVTLPSTLTKQEQPLTVSVSDTHVAV
jgi:hypothetical protein